MNQPEETAQLPCTDLPPDDSAAPASGEPPIAEVSRKGYQHLRSNELTEAIECFRIILESHPENNYALVGIGDAYRKRGRHHEAAAYYQRCLDIYPKNNYALFGLADCWRNLKQFHRAIAVWEEYLTIDGRNVTVLTRVADACRKTRNYERGKELYGRVMEIEPDNAYALIGLGHLHYDFKEYAEALRCWSRMREIAADQVDIRVLTSMGNCHRKMRTFGQGLELFALALQREPDNFYALFGMADCYRGLNQIDDSLIYWNRILAMAPDNKLILTRAGDAYRSMGNTEAARALYERALSVEFDLWAVHGLAQIARGEGRHADAAASLERMLQVNERLHRIYPDLLDCHLQAGNRQAAHATVERFRRLHLVHGRVSDEFERIRNRLRG